MFRELITKSVLSIYDFLHSQPVKAIENQFHQILFFFGVPPPYAGAQEIFIGTIAVLFTLVVYFILFGRRHRHQRKRLIVELAAAQNKMNELEEKLNEIAHKEAQDAARGETREIRVWMDGAFDMMHFGHMNAFRQARALGTYLVVGINDDKSITKCKGSPPLMNDAERTAAVAGCKFVDAVEPGCPYIMNSEYLDEMIRKHNLDYIVHGDDPCIVDGKDVYETAKRIGKYRSIPRTEGVSTTDLVGRMLLVTKDHHHQQQPQLSRDSDSNSNSGSSSSKNHSSNNPNTNLLSKTRKNSHRDSGDHDDDDDPDHNSHHSNHNGHNFLFERRSKFLTTNRMLRLFSQGYKDPPKNARIVYIDGAWDMFHAGHVSTLKKARAFGDYLIVGVFNDQIVNQHRGSNMPIMNLHERVLSVLGCKYVDDVLIDAPWSISREMIASLNISCIVHGTRSDCNINPNDYQVARELGIYQQVQSEYDLSVDEIISRISANEDRFVNKFKKKSKDEEEYYRQRYHLDGDSKNGDQSDVGTTTTIAPEAKKNQ